jgi:hypothetical protein
VGLLMIRLIREGARQVHLDLVNIRIREVFIVLSQHLLIKGRRAGSTGVVEVHHILGATEEEPDISAIFH